MQELNPWIHVLESEISSILHYDAMLFFFFHSSICVLISTPIVRLLYLFLVQICLFGFLFVSGRCLTLVYTLLSYRSDANEDEQDMQV